MDEFEDGVEDGCSSKVEYLEKGCSFRWSWSGWITERESREPPFIKILTKTIKGATLMQFKPKESSQKNQAKYIESSQIYRIKWSIFLESGY